MEITPQELQAILCGKSSGPVPGATVTIGGLGCRREIVTADRGWVFVGDVSEKENGDVVVSNGSCIRRWGTTQGLGELALKGALKETVLDPIPTTIIPRHAVIHRMLTNKL